jgi:orotidine-5'-phosphate decarboxylase
MRRNFRDMLEAKWAEGKFVCVGLDSEFEKIPFWAQRFDGDNVHIGETIKNFNKKIVDMTHDMVCAYKPNVKFYIGHGPQGIDALAQTITHIHEKAPDVPVILDAKDMDIGNTNAGSVKFAFEYLNADAITVNPYLGREALQPFLDCKDKGIIVLCRTSNPGAGEFQDLLVDAGRAYKLPLYQYVACQVRDEWNANGNCCLVVGATCPEELAGVRKIVGDMPILIPGIGAQGGDIKATVNAGKDSRGKGMIINSSRGIIFAEDPRHEAEKLHQLITQYLNQ